MVSRSVALGLGVTSIVAAGLVIGFGGKAGRLSAEAEAAAADRAEADNLFNRAAYDSAEQEFRRIVANNEGSRDPSVRDEIGIARLRLGYIEAKAGNWKEARAEFEAAAQDRGGSGTMREDFGGIPDQAAYQAAVCLVREKRRPDAIAAFKRFLKDFSQSPLIHAAHRRLTDLDPQNRDAYDALLQAVASEQEAKVRLELAMCGPRALAHLLDLQGKPAKTVEELSKMCGTAPDGTTFMGLRGALRQLGYAPVGYQLDRRDFARIATPAIWLEQNHYLVLERVDSRQATVYDPMERQRRKLPLPALDDPNFAAFVMTLAPMPLGEN